MRILLLLLLLTLGPSAQAGRESGGGNTRAAEFELMARALINAFKGEKPLTPFGVSGARLSAILTGLKVKESAVPLYKDGVPVEALNYPNENEIEFVGELWEGLGLPRRVLLVAHELLGLSRTPDPHWEVSGSILQKLAASYPGDWEKAFGRHLLTAGARGGAYREAKVLCSSHEEWQFMENGKLLTIDHDTSAREHRWLDGDKTYALLTYDPYSPEWGGAYVLMQYRDERTVSPDGRVRTTSSRGKTILLSQGQLFTSYIHSRNEYRAEADGNFAPSSSEANGYLRTFASDNSVVKTYPDGTVTTVLMQGPHWPAAQVATKELRINRAAESCTYKPQSESAPARGVDASRLRAFGLHHERTVAAHDALAACRASGPRERCETLERLYLRLDGRREALWESLVPDQGKIINKVVPGYRP